MLILLRHGQTPLNAEARLQGLVDPSLDDHGVLQAKMAGEHIRRRWDIDEVVTSSLARTQQTADHAGFGEHSLTVDDRWREISFGDLDGQPLGETLGHLSAMWKTDPGYSAPGGESMAALHERVSAACEDLLERSADRNILVVSHATPIKSAATWAAEGPISMIVNLWVSLGSVTVLGEVRGELRLREFNTQPHLD